MLAEPENDRGDRDLGPVICGTFGIPGGQVTKLFEPVKAPFHHISVLVRVVVDYRWTPTSGAFGFPTGNLVGLFRTGKRNTAFEEA